MASSGAVAVSLRDESAEPSTSVSEESLRLQTASTGNTDSSIGSSANPSQRTSLKARLPMFVAAAAAVIAIAALALGRTASRQADARPATSISSAETTVPDVRVNVTATPPTALITIDGALVPSPYVASVHRDKREHLVRVEAPGFDPYVEKVRFDNDVALTVALTKPLGARSASPASQPPTTPPVAAVSRWTPPTTTKPGSTREPTPANPTPPVTPETPTTTPAPANSAHKVVKPDIDKGDPWGNH
jgi:serine/threonine-protein kinase